MTDTPVKRYIVEYTSDEEAVTMNTDTLETINGRGYSCTWKANIDPQAPMVHFTWLFNWMYMRDNGFERLTGHITIRHAAEWSHDMPTRRIDVDFVGGWEVIKESLPTDYDCVHVIYDIQLIAHFWNYDDDGDEEYTEENLIEYKSKERTATVDTTNLETIDTNGISCVWNGVVNLYHPVVHYNWTFDWTKLKEEQRVDRLTGDLIIEHAEGWKNDLMTRTVNIRWVDGVETIIEDMATEFDEVHAKYKLELIPHYAPPEEPVSYEEMFAASEDTDAVLIVEGKRVHVNKEFLSTHSAFFRALLSSGLEIPIQNVSYEDFGLLMSIVYPNNVMPNDETSERLLKLAKVFLMPSVAEIVEQHLMNKSKLSNERLLVIADANYMSKLVEKCVQSMKTSDEIRALETSADYTKLSSETRQLLLTRRLELL